MSYLPTVNESGLSNEDKPKMENMERITHSMRNRMSLSSPSINNFLSVSNKELEKKTHKESTVSSSDSAGSILEKLYDFIVKDEKQKQLEKTVSFVEGEKRDEEFDKQQISWIKAIPEYVKTKIEEDGEEGILHKLWRYYKNFTMAKFVFRNWDTISKLLGLEKLTQTIKGLSDELGITGVIESIKSTIDDIMEGFSLGKVDVPALTGPPSLNAADPEKVKKIMKFYMDKGLTAPQAAGMLGNILQENPSLDPNKIGDKGKARGLFQWQGARQIGMGDTLESQLQHQWDEMTGKAPTRDPKSEAAFKELRKTKTSAEATAVIESGVTRAGKPMLENRVRYAAGAEELMNEPQTSTETKKEDKPVFSIAPKQDVFADTKTPTESVFATTTKKPETKKEQPTAQRVPKKSETPIKPQTSTPNVSGNNPLDIANKFLRKDEKTDASELNSFIGQNFGRFDVTKTPWCAAFANSVLTAAGYKGTGRADAVSFLNLPGVVYDKLTAQGNAQEAKPGDVAVFLKNGRHHVGFVQSVDVNGVNIVGGNQSDKDSGGQVSVSRRPFSELLGIRRPGTYGSPTLLAQSNAIATQTTKSQPEKSKSFMELATESLHNQMQVVSEIFSPDAAKNLEEKILEISGEIPRKDALNPDIPALITQNQTIINSIQTKKLINQDIGQYVNRDVPAIFASTLFHQDH